MAPPDRPGVATRGVRNGSSSEMTTNRKQAEGSARRTFVLRSWARPPGLMLLGLALVGLVQTGCQSDGCNTCGGFASRLSNRVSNGVQSLTAKVTGHFNGC